MRRVSISVCSTKSILILWANIFVRCCCNMINGVDAKNASKRAFSSVSGVK